MSTVSGSTFFGGTVPPPPAPVAPTAAPSLASQAWSVAGAVKNVTNQTTPDLMNRADKVNTILQRPNTSPIEKGLQVFGQGAGFAAHSLEIVANEIPGVKKVTELAGQGINALSKTPPIQALGNALGSNKTFQSIVQTYDSDPNFKDTVDAVANTFRLGGDVSAALDGVNAASAVTKKTVAGVKDLLPEKTLTAPDTVPPGGSGSGSLASNITSDVIPKVDAVVNHQVDRALNLTQGDVKNIHLSTGNEPGQFLAKNNLIGNTLEETTKNVDSYYKTNYQTVRDEIGKVKTEYKLNQAPGYTDALKQIQLAIKDTPGMGDSIAEVDNLLHKTTVTLNDVQRAKELLDEHFTLYKAVGDVKEGVAKQGLANIRNELKTFIEDQVQKNTGADIKALNNNVATARSIQDAIEERSTRGLTRSNISLGDMGTFFATTGAFGGNPLVGIAAVLVKKGLESPSFKLRFAKFLDGLSDSQRATLASKLEKGQVPQDLEELVSESPKSSSDSAAANGSKTTQSTNLSKNDIGSKPSTPSTKKQPLTKGSIANPFFNPKIHIDDLRQMSDFTDYVEGRYTPPDIEAKKLQADATGMWEKYLPNKNLPPTLKGISTQFKKLLDKNQTRFDASAKNAKDEFKKPTSIPKKK